MLNRDHINKYMWLTVAKLGVPTGPNTCHRGRSAEEVPAKAPDKPIPARQSLLGEESQRAMQVNPKAYTETVTVTVSVFKETARYSLVPLVEVTKSLLILACGRNR